MTKDESRKPCPFCGSTDLEACHKPDPSPPSYPDGVWVVECFGCGALGPFCEELQNATKTWNDRGVVEPPAGRSDAEDAERYRWMRQHYRYGGYEKHRLEWYLPRRYGDDIPPLETQLDEAIDEQRQVNRGGERG